MKTFIVTADTYGAGSTVRDTVIHCITSPCANHAELALRQHYPDAAHIRAVNARDADRRLASRATALEAQS